MMDQELRSRNWWSWPCDGGSPGMSGSVTPAALCRHHWSVDWTQTPQEGCAQEQCPAPQQSVSESVCTGPAPGAGTTSECVHRADAWCPGRASPRNVHRARKRPSRRLGFRTPWFSQLCWDGSCSRSTSVFPDVCPRICRDSEHGRGVRIHVSFPSALPLYQSLFCVCYSSLSYF